NASVTVNPTSVQYSDMVTFSTTILGGAPKFTGGPQAAASVTFKIGTQIMGTVPFAASGSNLTATYSCAVLDESLASGTPPNGQVAPGNRTVTAAYNSVDPNYSVSPTATTPLTITRENARVNYSGVNILATASATTTTATVN